MEEQRVFSEIGAKSVEPVQEQGHAPEIPPELSESVSWLASRMNVFWERDASINHEMSQQDMGIAAAIRNYCEHVGTVQGYIQRDMPVGASGVEIFVSTISLKEMQEHDKTFSERNIKQIADNRDCNLSLELVNEFRKILRYYPTISQQARIVSERWAICIDDWYNDATLENKIFRYKEAINRALEGNQTLDELREYNIDKQKEWSEQLN